MTTTNDLLDRMAEALRCWRQFPFTADKIEITDAALAEYDRLRASPSQEKARVVEVAAKAIYKTFDGSQEHPWIERGNSTKQDEARRYARAALATHPTPDADAVAPVAWQFRQFDSAEQAWSDYWHECSETHAKMLRDPRHAPGYEVRDLYTRPAPTVATREAVSALIAFHTFFGGKTEGLFFQFGMPAIELYNAVIAALAAPPTVRAGDEG